MSATYTTKQASSITGASPQAIRLYTNTYARYLSTEATPEQGYERSFTAADLKVIAFVYQRTKAKASHRKVLEALAEGALESFAWEVQDAPAAPLEDDAVQPYPLVLAERLRDAYASLEEYKEDKRALTEEVKELRQQLGEALGELKAVKALGERNAPKSRQHKPPRWWTALFGENA